MESFIWEKIPCNLIEQNTSDWNKNETMQKLILATEAGPAYLSWAPGFISGFSRVRVTRSLALCVCFVDRCLSFCSFSFGHCVVCPSYIYKLWLPLWYIQTLLETNMAEHCSKNYEPMQNMNVTLLIFSSFLTNYQIFNKRNTRWAISKICVPIQITICNYI